MERRTNSDGMAGALQGSATEVNILTYFNLYRCVNKLTSFYVKTVFTAVKYIIYNYSVFLNQWTRPP